MCSKCEKIIKGINYVVTPDKWVCSHVDKKLLIGVRGHKLINKSSPPQSFVSFVVCKSSKNSLMKWWGGIGSSTYHEWHIYWCIIIIHGISTRKRIFWRENEVFPFGELHFRLIIVPRYVKISVVFAIRIWAKLCKFRCFLVDCLPLPRLDLHLARLHLGLWRSKCKNSSKWAQSPLVYWCATFCT